MRHSLVVSFLNTIVSATFCVAVSVLNLPGASAQPDAVDFVQDRLDELPKNSVEWLENRQLQFNFVNVINGPLADKVSKENLDLARRLGDSNLEAVSLMQRAHVEIWIHGRKDRSEDLEKAAELFQQDDERIDVAAEYYRSRFLVELGTKSSGLENSLRQATLLSGSCSDPVRRASLYINLAYTRLGVGEISHKDAELRDMIQFIRTVGELHDLPSMQANSFALEATSNPDDINAQMELFEHALEIAQQHPNAKSGVLYDICTTLVERYAAKERFDDAVNLSEESLARMEEFGLPIVAGGLRVRHAYLLANLEQTQEALVHLKRFLAGPFSGFDVQRYHDACRIAMLCHLSLGELDNAIEYATILSDNTHLAELVEAQGKDDLNLARVKELEGELLVASDQHQEITEQLQVATQTAEKHADLSAALSATILAILCLTMLACGLLFFRARLARARLELAEEKMNTAETAQASEQKRLESLSLMAGGVAHDFNNLLVGVLSGAELLQLPSLSTDIQKECLNSIVHSCARAAELSKQMLTYAGYRTTVRESYDINVLLSEAEVVMKTLATSSTLNVSLASLPLNVKVDKVQAQQVLLNLLANADKACHGKEGVVTVESYRTELTQDQADHPAFVLSPKGGGKFAVVEVRDTGVGAPSEDLRSMFEPFYTRFKVGRGLGLAVVYGSMAANEGAIEVQALPDQGLMFRVYFPLEYQNANQSTRNSIPKVPRTNVSDGLKGRRILVVDDEFIVRKMVRELLQRSHMKVTITETREDALDILENQDVDLILMDILMPGMELSKFFALSKFSTPVVLMTGNSQANIEDLSKDERVKSLVVKPFTLQSLQDEIATALEDSHHPESVFS